MINRVDDPALALTIALPALRAFRLSEDTGRPDLSLLPIFKITSNAIYGGEGVIEKFASDEIADILMQHDPQNKPVLANI